MKYEEMTGAINLEELEIKAEEVNEVSGGGATWSHCSIFVWQYK